MCGRRAGVLCTASIMLVLTGAPVTNAAEEAIP